MDAGEGATATGPGVAGGGAGQGACQGMSRQPRILFVAMADSVHAARWISQLAGQGFDVHVFPIFQHIDGEVHEALRDVTVHHACLVRPTGPASVRLAGAWPWPFPGSARRLNWLWRRARLRRGSPFEADQARVLARLIARLRPDLVHSLEMQHAGYLTLEARRLSRGEFPPWLYTPWGSDLVFFGRLEEHRPRIEAVLRACDFYWPKNRRDARLAREMGFAGEILPEVAGNGGYDLGHLRSLRRQGPPSARRLVLLKGYQSWAGRALFGLRALVLSSQELHSYRVVVYLADEEMRLAASLAAATSGLAIEVQPPAPHDTILGLQGQARVSLGISATDGVPNSLLEAMAMGAFPIESEGSCADEWIERGTTGLIVPPEDPAVIARALQHALRDDALVDRAAESNLATIEARLDAAVVRPMVAATYRRVLLSGRSR